MYDLERLYSELSLNSDDLTLRQILRDYLELEGGYPELLALQEYFWDNLCFPAYIPSTEVGCIVNKDFRPNNLSCIIPDDGFYCCCEFLFGRCVSSSRSVNCQTPLLEMELRMAKALDVIKFKKKCWLSPHAIFHTNMLWVNCSDVYIRNYYITMDVCVERCIIHKEGADGIDKYFRGILNS